jgi:hypothetical protein
LNRPNGVQFVRWRQREGQVAKLLAVLAEFGGKRLGGFAGRAEELLAVAVYHAEVNPEIGVFRLRTALPATAKRDGATAKVDSWPGGHGLPS